MMGCVTQLFPKCFYGFLVKGSRRILAKNMSCRNKTVYIPCEVTCVSFPVGKEDQCFFFRLKRLALNKGKRPLAYRNKSKNQSKAQNNNNNNSKSLNLPEDFRNRKLLRHAHVATQPRPLQTSAHNNEQNDTY